MSAKTGLKYALLAFVGVSLATIVRQQLQSGAPAPGGSGAAVATPSAAKQPAAPPAVGSKILVYYFHTSVRCPTCRWIEALTEQTLRTAFADGLRTGLIEWRPTNVQLPENQHFIRDYELFTKSVVIVRLKDGRQAEWKNLEWVWRLVSDRQTFSAYIQNEVSEYLKKL